MREPRAYRPAWSARAAADELCRDAEAGKLPAEAVRAVLTAAGQPPRPAPRPAGLSERECEVLSLIARGMATKQAARQLGISPKTCDHHIQRLYRKTGLSTRACATLFALEHGLIAPTSDRPPGPDREFSLLPPAGRCCLTSCLSAGHREKDGSHGGAAVVARRSTRVGPGVRAGPGFLATTTQ